MIKYHGYFFVLVFLFIFHPLFAQQIYVDNWSVVQVGGVGINIDGADLSILQLDVNPRPDMILMAYDNPGLDQANEFRYKVGFNLNTNGIAESWTSPKKIAGVGNIGNGAGLVAGDLFNQGINGMIPMAYDDPNGMNDFRYRIANKINTSGNVVEWNANHNWKSITGVGDKGEGAALAIGNIDDDPRKELVYVAYHAPDGANEFRYKIIFNISKDSNSFKQPNTYSHTGGVGNWGDGCGACLYNLDENPRPELIFMAYDDPLGMNYFRLKIGWNIDKSGNVPRWTTQNIEGVGQFGQGAGIIFTKIDNNPLPEIILMAYDSTVGDDNFWYKIGWNVRLNQEDVDNQYSGYYSTSESRHKAYVEAFIDEFSNSGWELVDFLPGDKCSYLDWEHLKRVDKVDLAYLSGHGSPSEIWNCNLIDCSWGSFSSPAGTGDLEYIVFHSCNTMQLNDDWRERWANSASNPTEDRPFSGLHVAMGYRTKHYHSGLNSRWEADEFAENLKEDMPVVEAWYEAIEDYRWATLWIGNKPSIFYLQPYKDEKIDDHNSPDYKYGDADYLLDATYME